MIETVARWLQEAQHAVAFTGAGISTESGIPDFRSPGGIWAQTQPVYFDEFLASAEARREYWRQKTICYRDFGDAQPNTGHQILAKWEESGLLKGVITQNIDGLHQRAGSQTVWELHGTALEVMCLDCQRRFDTEEMTEEYERLGEPPPCPVCGGLLKHATVSFGQALPADVLESAARAARQSDLFLAIGSSLVVHPAASLPQMAAESGAKLVIINRDETPLDYLAAAIFRESIGEVLAKIDRAISPSFS